MIKAFVIALIMSVSVKPGTVENVNADIITVNDGADYWDVYADGMHQGERVNMIMIDNKVIGLF